MEYGESGRDTGARRRTIEFAGVDHGRALQLEAVRRALEGSGDLTEGEVRPLRILRMREAELFVGGRGDECADLSEFGSRTWFHDQAEVRSVDEHEAVAPEGRVDSNRPDAGHVESGVEAISERREVDHPDPFSLPVTAFGLDGHGAAGCFHREPGDRLDHRHSAGLEQHRRDAHGVTPRHRRGVARLHDDETPVDVRQARRDEQVHVTKDATTGLVEDKVP